jgi:arylsulfatase A-like enzyme
LIRADEWKLVYHHRHRPQLFNLRDDPDELHDLAEDPRCESVRRNLTERVLAGWDPDQIEAECALKRQQSQILRHWARATHPAESHRFPLTPEMHYLHDPIPEGISVVREGSQSP